LENDSFRGFEAVWRRVTAPADGSQKEGALTPACREDRCPHRADGARGVPALIEGFLNREYALCRAYTALARRWAGQRCSRDFHRAACAASERMAALQTVCCLLTGDSCPLAPPVPISVDDLTDSLCALWHYSRGLSQAYLRASQGECEGFGEMFARFSRAHQRQINILFEIIQSFMK